MKIKPYADYILVVRNEAPEKTPSGIILAPISKEKPTEGVVVAVGPGKVLANGTVVRPDVEPGNIVLFTKFTGHEVEIDGKMHLFMRSEDILAVKSEPG